MIAGFFRFSDITKIFTNSQKTGEHQNLKKLLTSFDVTH